MIPTIEDILAQLSNEQISLKTATGYINAHLEALFKAKAERSQ